MRTSSLLLNWLRSLPNPPGPVLALASARVWADIHAAATMQQCRRRREAAIARMYHTVSRELLL